MNNKPQLFAPYESTEPVNLLKYFELLRRPVVILLVFLFVFSPIATVLAAETIPLNTVSSTPTSESNPPVSASEATLSIPESSIPELKVVGEALQEEVAEEITPPPAALMSSSDPDINLQVSAGKSLQAQADEVSGALVTEYPLTIPPGRNGFQPDLKLQYNSQNSNQIDSEFGAGWSLNIPYIERVNKTGVNNFYGTTTQYFSSSLSGELVASTTATSTFISRTDNGEFLDYTFLNNSWVAKDKKGYSYYFGSATTSTSTTEELYNKSLFNDANLVSYYRMEGSGNDSKGSNNGTSTNVSFSTGNGYFNQGGRFVTASSSKIDMGNASSLRITGDITISLWLKATITSGGPYGVVMKHDDGSDRGYGVYWDSNTITFNASSNNSGSQSYIFYASMPDTNWHHWAFVFSPNGSSSIHKIYRDGVQVSDTVSNSSFSGTSMYNSSQPFVLGEKSNGGWYADGSLDDVAVFNRQLTSNEIAGIYPNGGFNDSNLSQLHDPYNSNRTSKWILDKVVEPTGGEINYEYAKTNNQVYPYKIYYAGNSATSSIFTVNFTKETRTDISTSTRTGFSVVTNSRVNEITVKKDNEWLRKYVLSYTTGDNGYKSLLSSIVESGKDENNSTTTLPAVNFTYQGANGGWDNSTSTIPVALKYANILDINGDGYADIMNSFTDSTTTTMVTYLNNTQGGWATSTPYAPPVIFYGTGTNCSPVLCDKGVRFADLNGDGLVDMLNNASPAYLNTGTGWTSSSTWSSPLAFTNVNNNYGNNQNAEVADINGDGLPDVFKVWNDGASEYHNTYLNNGNGWTYTGNYSVAAGIDKTARVNADINGDGLIDLIQGYDSTGSGSDYNFAVINNSTSTWQNYTPYKPPLYFVEDTTDKGVRLFDMNGDGLPDLSQHIDSSSDIKSFYPNTGSGWGSNNAALASPLPFASEFTASDTGTRITDLNGDAMSDVVQSNEVSNVIVSETKVLTSKRVDMLTKITYPQGGSSNIVYKPASKYIDGSNNLLNPDIRSSIDTVYQIISHDGLATSTTDTYTYKGGKNYFNSAIDKRFAGFSEIDKTDLVGNVVKTFYHQGDSSASTTGEYLDNYFKIGKPYRVEQYDSAGNLFKKILNKWESSTTTASGTSAFIKLTQKVESDYEGDSGHKDKAESYTYNTKGDVTQRVEWGEVTGSNDGSFSDTGSDKFTTTFTYATSSTSTVISLLSGESTVDQSSTKVKESRYYYDTLALGLVNKGNLTKKEDWKTGSTYINSQKTYNSYGLVTSDTDSRGKVTTYAYDANNLYPATVTNPVGLVSQYVYDYSSGKVGTTTDPHSNIFVNTYDGLDRLLLQKQPDPSATTTLLTSVAYTYTDTSKANAIKKSVYLDASTTADSYIYFDGLKRKKQVRQEAEGTDYSVLDFTYNNLGLLQKESLPYFSSGYATTTATSTATLFINYYYDSLGRVATSSNAIGTTTNAYLDWRTTSTDPNGKTKDLYSDAYGNLIQVDEHNSSSTYSTTYTYDYNRSLTNITDSAGNVRNFTYDGLGRRLTAQDLHSSGDGTYGSYSYTYDDSGNMTQKVDPKSQTVNYTYDDINRQLTEDYTDTGGTEVTYTYDTCTQGKGKLCTASSTAVNISNVYNALGQLTQETKVITGNSYVTSYTYDRQGNQLTITNPDNSQVKYVYNSAGLLEQLQRKESTDGSYVDVVTDFDYSPLGQLTEINYANGVITTNTYDPTKLYRLVRKVTTLPEIESLMMRQLPVEEQQETKEGNLLDSVLDYESATSTSESKVSTSTPITTTTTPESIPVAEIEASTTPVILEIEPVATTTETTTTPEITNELESSTTPVLIENNTLGFFSKIYLWITNSLIKATNFIAGVFEIKTVFAAITELYNTTFFNDANLTAYYQLEDVTDTKNNYDLTNHNSVTFTSAQFNNGGSTGTGNGSKRLKISDRLGLTSADDFTMSIWVKPNEQITSGTWCLFDHRDSVYSSYITIWYEYNAGTYRLNFNKTINGGGGTNNYYTYTLPTDSFTHLVLTYAGSTGTVTGYVNGSQVTQGAYSSNSGGSEVTDAVTISATGNGYLYSSATFDDASIFSRTLTSQEVADLYDAAAGSGTKIQNVFYTYDSNGNITQLTESASTTLERTLTYTYDDLNRLTNASSTRATSTPYNYSYTYDRVGNMLSRVENGTTTTYTYATNTAAYLNPHAAQKIGSATSTYDNNGNLLSIITSGATSTAYTWDYNNRLTQASSTGISVTYTYDSGGQRVKQTQGATTTIYSSKGYNITGSTPTKHIFLPDGTMIATIVGTGATTTVSYIHTDHLGGMNVATSDAGEISELADAFPYGTTRINEQNGLNEQRKGISGHEYDSNTGLTYANARYYNSNNARFISQDPLFLSIGDKPINSWYDELDLQKLLSDPQKLNSYSYAKNNPIINVDPDGKAAVAAIPFAIPYLGLSGFGLPLLAGAGLAVIAIPGGQWVLSGPDSIGNQSTPASLLETKPNVQGDTQKAKPKTGSDSKPTAQPVPKPQDLQGKTPEEIDQIMKDKGWQGEPSREGGGTRYPNPDKPGEQVRIQPGNKNDPNPVKQGPYGRISSDGKVSPPIPLKGNSTLSP